MVREVHLTITVDSTVNSSRSATNDRVYRAPVADTRD